MSMLLPGKLWIQFLTPVLFFVVCFWEKRQFICPPKKCIEYPYSNTTRKRGESKMETSTHHLILQETPQSRLTNRDLRHCGFNWPPFPCSSNNTTYCPFPFRVPTSLSLSLCSVDTVNGTTVEPHWHQHHILKRVLYVVDLKETGTLDSSNPLKLKNRKQVSRTL